VINQAQAKTTKKQKQTRVTTQAQASTALHPNNSKATKLKNRKVGGQNKTAPIKKANINRSKKKTSQKQQRHNQERKVNQSQRYS